MADKSDGASGLFIRPPVITLPEEVAGDGAAIERGLSHA